MEINVQDALNSSLRIQMNAACDDKDTEFFSCGKRITNEVCLHIYARILIDLLTYFSVKTLWLSKRCVIVSWFFYGFQITMAHDILMNMIKALATHNTHTELDERK